MNILAKAQQWQTFISSEENLSSFEQCLRHYHTLYQGESLPIAWTPDEATIEQAHVTELQRTLGLSSYQELYQWSIQHKGEFWEAAIQKLGISFNQPYQQIIDATQRPENPQWLPGARLNIVESCFQAPDDKVALVVEDEAQRQQAWTYQDLRTLVNRVSSGLQRLGLQPKDRIVLYMPLGMEAVVAYLGILQAGMVAVLVADSFTANELKSRTDIAQAKAVITVDQYPYNGKPLNVYEKVKAAGAPPCVVVNTSDTTTLRTEDHRWEDFLGETKADMHIAEPYDITGILFSSGTTREPKAIPWTHLTPIKCAADAYFHHDVHPEDVVTWTTGMGWMMGPWTIFAALMNRATLALFTGSAATAAFGQFVERNQVSVLGTIPSLVRVWRNSRIMEGYDWGVRVFSSTGEPSNAEDYLYLMWLNRFKAPVIEYCGGTEIGGGYITGATVQPASPATFTTPALGMELLFRNEEDSALRAEQDGEVFIVPPSIGLSQTLLNHEHHEEYYQDTPTTTDGRTLRKHGDNYHIVARVGETVFYKSQGRADDAMNLGGIKVSAVEIEKLLDQHPAITETAAVAVAPPEGGPEQLVIYYITHQEVNSETLKREWQRSLSTELNPLFRIHDLVEQDTLPRTVSNKLMRRTLRQQHSRGK